MSSKLTLASHGEIKCPFCEATSTYLLEAYFYKSAPPGSKWRLAPLIIPACRHIEDSEWQLTNKAQRHWQATRDLESANSLEWEVLVHSETDHEVN
jgi:hypothetical protein